MHDIGHDNEISYMVTEFVEGQTLRQSRPEGLRQQIDVAAQIADALAAAHARGITHRDLKPENIMVTPEGRAKILDFGLAKSSGPVGEEESTQTLPGTVEYISPEQVRGQSADTRSDIFSFGAVLYELFTGQRAFLGGSTLVRWRRREQSINPGIHFRRTLASFRTRCDRPCGRAGCDLVLRAYRSRSFRFGNGKRNGAIDQRSGPTRVKLRSNLARFRRRLLR